MLLCYSIGYPLGAEIAHEMLSKIKSYRTYEILASELDEKLVELYLLKLLKEGYSSYDGCQTVASICTIFDWHRRREELSHVSEIELPFAPWNKQLFELLSHRFSDYKIYFKNKPDPASIKQLLVLKYPALRASYRIIIFFFKKIFNRIKAIEKDSLFKGQPTIAIRFVEGLNVNNRSDLFWYKNSNVPPTSMLIYSESKKEGRVEQFLKNRLQREIIDKLEIKFMSLDEFHFPKINSSNDYSKIINQLQKRVERTAPMDNLELWLQAEIKRLVSNMNSWYSFFMNFKVRIHIDPTENNLKNLTKNLVLRIVQGCSIGKIRSYIPDNHTSMDAYYPNDIFFTYGRDSAQRYCNTNNVKRNILLSGFPFSGLTQETKEKIEKIVNTIKSSGANFIVLLIDSNHGYNDDLMQIVYSPDMAEYYRYFLEWILEDPKIGLIVKSKKDHLINELPGIQNLFDSVIETGRFYNTLNTYHVKASDYSKYVDMAVGTGSHISGALIDCVVNGAKGILYDYTNMRHTESELYEWGENRVIFQDLGDILKSLKNYKQNPQKYSTIGDWAPILDDLDPFRDDKGADRIGEYIFWLQEGYKKGWNKDKVIDCANQEYAKKWGEDKVYLTKLSEEFNAAEKA